MAKKKKYVKVTTYKNTSQQSTNWTGYKITQVISTTHATIQFLIGMLNRNLAVVDIVVNISYLLFAIAIAVVRYRHCRFNNHTIKPFKSEDLLYDE